MPKYVVLVGSIMSGLGKGIALSSIAKLFQSRGFSVVPIKFDGYLNVDCGTMNPFRHGEVFVLDDGSEVDMDFGTYERFLNFSLSNKNSITGGKIFKQVIEKERKGEFLGRDVQVVPHLTNELKSWIRSVGTGADVVFIEVGGTVGDLENSYFLEAIRQLKIEEDLLLIQLTYVPSLSSGEQKTKPTQHATRLLQSMGLQPDVVLCRTDEPLSEESKNKISLFCNVSKDAVFDDPLVSTIYELPLVFEQQNMFSVLAKKLALDQRESDLDSWKERVNNLVSDKVVDIAIVGKYIAVKDAYASVKEALVHASSHTKISFNLHWIDSEALPDLSKFDGIVVPGGFGKRGVEGKLSAINYCRINKVPFLGLCLGMQLMAIEFARNVCNLDAYSSEFDSSKVPIIDLLPEQKDVSEKGGTMRKGAVKILLKEGTIAHSSYGKKEIFERHRHRYAVNNEFLSVLESSGLVVSGVSEDDVVEILEWKDSFGVGTQAHAEFNSRFEDPAPLFVSFLKESLNFRTHHRKTTLS